VLMEILELQRYILAVANMTAFQFATKTARL
jgi:hypothetical protein